MTSSRCVSRRRGLSVRLPFGGSVRHAAGRAECGREPAAVRWLQRHRRGGERSGEQRRGGRSHSDQLPASLRHSSLTSTVNAAMQGPSGATAAVQLLLTWIQASVVNQGSLGWGGGHVDIFRTESITCEIQYTKCAACTTVH